MYINVPLHSSCSTEPRGWVFHTGYTCEVVIATALKVPWTLRSKARGATCFSLGILSWYLLSQFLIPTTLLGRPAALHQAGVDIVLFPSLYLFFLYLQLVLWALNTGQKYFFPLYNSISRNWKQLHHLLHYFLLNIIQTAVLSITIFWVALPGPPTNKSISFLKENHCIFT